MNKNFKGISDLSKGKAAEYTHSTVPYLNGNPLIECIPPSLTREEVYHLFTFIVKAKKNIAEYTDEDRLALVNMLKFFRVPFTQCHHLASLIHTLIITGYLNRNPIAYEDLKKLRQLKEWKEIYSDLELIPKNILEAHAGATTAMIIGISGAGKTTTVDTILKRFPDFYYHDLFNGHKLTRVQIPYIKIDCPANASIRGFYDQILKQIDIKLGTTNYFQVYKSQSESAKLTAIISLFYELNVGLLCIDEIQNLLHGPNGGALLNDTITMITNLSEIPILFIGTPAASQLLEVNLRSSRRFATKDLLFWDRFQKDDPEWDQFVQILWRQQFLRSKTPLTSALKESFYDATQGIVALAVQLYARIQEDLILDPDDLDEKIYPEDIQRVSEQSLSHYHPFIKAIQSNDKKRLLQFEDIHFNWDEDIFDKTIDSFNLPASDFTVSRVLESPISIEEIADSILEIYTFTHVTREELIQIIVDTQKELGAAVPISKVMLKAQLRALQNEQNFQAAPVDSKEKPLNCKALPENSIGYIWEQLSQTPENFNAYELLKEQNFIAQKEEYNGNF